VLEKDSETWKKANVVLVPGVSAFLTYEEYLLDCEQVIVVFDSPIRLDGLSGIDIQDVGKRKVSFAYDFIAPDWDKFKRSVANALEREELQTFKRRSPNVLPVMLNSTSASLMSGFQTFFYTIKEQGLRDSLRTIFIEWFFASEKVTVKHLRNRFCRMLSERSHPAVDRLLEGKPLESLKKVVTSTVAARDAGKSVSAAKLDTSLEGTGLSAFDVRYIMNAYEKIQKVQEPEDLSLTDMRKQDAEAALDDEQDMALAEAEAECLRG
jgi:hypothetical protein